MLGVESNSFTIQSDAFSDWEGESLEDFHMPPTTVTNSSCGASYDQSGVGRRGAKIHWNGDPGRSDHDGQHRRVTLCNVVNLCKLV